MIDIQRFLLRLSIIFSAIIHFIGKTISMALSSPPITPPPSASSSGAFSWLGMVSPNKHTSFHKFLEISKKKKSHDDDSPSEKIFRRQSAFEDKSDDDGQEKNGTIMFSPTEICTSAGEWRRPSSTTLSRKRPAQLVIPAYCPESDFADRGKRLDIKEIKVKKVGREFFVGSKRGRRPVMEDRHAFTLDIFNDPKQAFFAVIDGHGGHAAADYVAENLGNNIVKELERVVGNNTVGNQIEAALRGGYWETDRQFLAAEDSSGGACAVGVLLKDGELHVANVGDCRVVLSKEGRAIRITNDHRLSREDERARIENSGGYLHCHNGAWRVNGSLAVSRAFGDVHLKNYIIAEPEIVKLPLTSDCQFLLMASDGLWDKVSEQEAVDLVLEDRNSVECCRKLIDLSSSRGNKDDITVMVVNLSSFVA